MLETGLREMCGSVSSMGVWVRTDCGKDRHFLQYLINLTYSRRKFIFQISCD